MNPKYSSKCLNFTGFVPGTIAKFTAPFAQGPAIPGPDKKKPKTSLYWVFSYAKYSWEPNAYLKLKESDVGIKSNSKIATSWIELTEKDLILTLSRHGVKPVLGVGSKFDPNVHQAVAQIPSDEEKGNVATVMQTGFTLGDRTLRAAMVAVSTGPSKK